MSSLSLGERYVLIVAQNNGYTQEKIDKIKQEVAQFVGEKNLPTNWEDELASAVRWASSSFEAEARAIDRRLRSWQAQ